MRCERRVSTGLLTIKLACGRDQVIWAERRRRRRKEDDFEVFVEAMAICMKICKNNHWIAHVKNNSGRG